MIRKGGGSFFSVRAHAAAILLSAAALSGAVTAATEATWSAPPSTANKAGEIIRQPLKDLNVVQDEIPAVLLKAKENPYAAPDDTSCAFLKAEIEKLDVALGQDLDMPNSDDDSLYQKISNETFNLARGAVSGLIPYRGVLRRVTGAEKHARAINEALLAGAVRRSYLKGFGENLGCAYPAAPRRAQDN